LCLDLQVAVPIGKAVSVSGLVKSVIVFDFENGLTASHSDEVTGWIGSLCAPSHQMLTFAAKLEKDNLEIPVFFLPRSP